MRGFVDQAPLHLAIRAKFFHESWEQMLEHRVGFIHSYDCILAVRPATDGDEWDAVYRYDEPLDFWQRRRSTSPYGWIGQANVAGDFRADTVAKKGDIPEFKAVLPPR